MLWLLQASILIRLAAMAWSAVLLNRLRDWRMGLLTAMLGLMALRQVLALRRLIASGEPPAVGVLEELPGLLVSLLAVLVVALLDRLVVTRRLAVDRRQAAEAELEDVSERYRRLVDNAPDIIFSIAPDGRLTALNPAFELTTGHRRADWLGRGFEELLVPADRERARRLFDRVMAGETVARQELGVLRKGGQPAVGEFSVTPDLHGSGVAGLLGVARDVTDRRLAETAIQRIADGISAAWGDAFFRRLVKSLAEVLETEYALLAEVVDGRLEMARTLAVCADGQMVDNFDYSLAGSPCEGALQGGSCGYPSGVQERFPRDELLARMGVESYIGTPLRDSAGRPLGLLAVLGRAPRERLEPALSILQIFALRAAAELERRSAEQALRRSEERYRSLFEESLDAIFITTPEGKIVDINAAGVELFGYDSKEELLEVDVGRDLYWDPWDRERSVRQLASEGTLRDHELALKRRDGSKLLVVESSTAVRDERGEVLYYQGILKDVSDRRRLQEELRRSQSMEAVGRLAGGIAHDFNNLLTVINGQSDLILAGLGNDDPLSEELGKVQAAGRRAAALTRQLLILGRREAGTRELVDLNRLVSEREALVRQVVGGDIQVITRLAPELVEVRVDRAQLEQVLLNLAVNARRAIFGRGRLTIETRNVEVSAAAAPRGLAGGRYAQLSVEDTGTGFDEAALEHLFEPFYSPHSDGKSGLGLATVYGIIEQHGGTIRVDSEPGRGTRFEILLPEAALAERVAAAPVREVAAGGRETILLAEDEPPVRDLLCQYLVKQGYEVLEAADGDEAIDVAGRASWQIDLLLADMVMPGMRGADLARQVVEHRPTVKVLLMSGYTDVRVAGLAGEPPLADAEFIQKPFSTELLGRRVRELLDA